MSGRKRLSAMPSAGMRRRRHVASGCSPGCSNHDAFDSSDELHMYKGTCSLLERYCLNPLLASCVNRQQRRLAKILPSVLSITLIFLLGYAKQPTMPPYDARVLSLKGMPIQVMNTELPDYGGLDIVSLRNARQFSRQISPDDEVAHEMYRENSIAEANDTRADYSDDQLANHECHQPSWASRSFPTCNNIHETDFAIDLQADSDIHSYQRGFGQYRDAWLVNNTASKEMFILKSLRLTHDYDMETAHQVLLDAIVMELLTSSPRIINIYCHCGTSVAVQFMPDSVEHSVVPLGEWEDESNEPRNHISLPDKLGMALEMAESIADLHGFSGGVIVHRDIQLRQWLRQLPNGNLMLGDFNLAQVLSWNYNERKYCKFETGRGAGNYLAPEEIRKTGLLDEKVDVFSFCNNIYMLLTGQGVILDYYSDAAWQEETMANYTNFVARVYGDRSFAEGKLVELLERCWEPDPSKRIDIFEVVRFLREAITDNDFFETKSETN